MTAAHGTILVTSELRINVLIPMKSCMIFWIPSIQAAGKQRLSLTMGSVGELMAILSDELPEFRSDVLEVLQHPLEDGTVTVSRVAGAVTFPSRFMLVCAMNNGQQLQYITIMMNCWVRPCILDVLLITY